MIITINTKTEYVPEWNDNQKDDTPIVIEHLTPTMALYNELIVSPSIKVKYDENGKMGGGEAELALDNKKIVRKMVTKIRNLTLNIDGKDTPITSGSDLFGPGIPSVISGLVDEIGAHLQGLLSDKRVDAKN